LFIHSNNIENNYLSAPVFCFATGNNFVILPNDEITEPNVTRDLLMLAPSFSRTPVAPVESARSLENNF